MTPRRRSTFAAVAVIAAGAVGVWWWTSSRAASPRVRVRSGLVAGEQRVYDLTWDGTSVADGATLPGGMASYRGDVHVRARLVVRGLGRDGDAELVGYRLDGVERAAYRVLERDVLAGVDATAGELVASIGPDGRLRELRPDPSAPPAVDLLLRAIAQQSAVTLGAGEAWDAAEPGPNGVARMRYRRERGDRLVRARTGYDTLAALPGACPTCREELDGTAAIRLDRRGVVRELDDREHLIVSEDGASRLAIESRFTLRAISSVPSPRALPRLDGRVGVAPAAAGMTVSDDDAERAKGWTLSRIGSTVMRFVATGATPGEGTWMHGVAAYLRVHPEACAELLRMFAAPGLPASGRELIASMLSAAGSPAAQTALRDGTDWLARGNDREAASVLSRFALVKQPTAATVEWLAERRLDRDEHPAAASAATLALGASIGRLDDQALAARHAATLRDELIAATEPSERVELLGALGNAGRAADAALIAGLGHDPEVSVRQELPLSARKLPDDAALPLLVTLSGDDDATVRRLALEMLQRRSPGREIAGDATRAAVAAGAGDDEIAVAVELLAPHASDGEIAALLRSLLDHAGRHSLRVRIHHVLGGSS